MLAGGGPSRAGRPVPAPTRPSVGSGGVTDVLSDDQTSALRDRIHDLMPQVRADLEALTRIPSVSLDAFDQAHVEASAEATAALLRAEGLEVEIVREGGRPAVIGHRAGSPRRAAAVEVMAGGAGDRLHLRQAGVGEQRPAQCDLVGVERGRRLERRKGATLPQLGGPGVACGAQQCGAQRGQRASQAVGTFHGGTAIRRSRAGARPSPRRRRRSRPRAPSR